MPRDGSGNYTLPLGNPVIDGTIIDVNWANPTMSDIAVQLNNVITRDGVLGFVAPVKIVDGALASPGLQFVSEGSTGLTRPVAQSLALVVNGVEIARLVPTGVNVNGTLGTTGNVGVGGNLTVTGSTTVGANLQVNGGINNAAGVNLEVPIGAIIDYAGTAVLPGYFPCDGQAVSRVTYATLFARIGTAWGAGDGTTTFNVPDLRRYTTIGSGGTAGAGVGNTVGSRGGAEIKQLTTLEMPVHNHGVTDLGHSHGISDPGHSHTASDSGHLHGTSPWATARLSINNITANWFGNGGEGGIGSLANTQVGHAAISVAGALTNIGSTNGSGTNVSTQNSGGNNGWSLYQPTAVVTKMIRAL